MIDYIGETDVVVVDFKTFLVKLRKVVNIFLKQYKVDKEKKEEIETLFRIIQQKVLA